jgi:hypothetical protein
MERGSGNVRNNMGLMEINSVINFSKEKLIEEIEIDKQAVVLDHKWLDWVDENPNTYKYMIYDGNIGKS